MKLEIQQKEEEHWNGACFSNNNKDEGKRMQRNCPGDRGKQFGSSQTLHKDGVLESKETCEVLFESRRRIQVKILLELTFLQSIYHLYHIPQKIKRLPFHIKTVQL